MARFLSKLLLLTPIILVLALIEMLARQVPNDYYYKNKWLTEHGSQLKILVLGGSNSYFGIDPQYFSEKAFNAAQVSQSLNYDFLIADKFIPKCDSLRFLIIAVTAPSLFFTIDNSEESWRAKNYHLFYGFNNYDHFYERLEPANQFTIYSNNLVTALQRIVPYYRNGYYKLNCSESGFGINYSLEKRAKDWEKEGPTAAKRHTFTSSYKKEYEKNVGYLKNIIAECDARKIKVILITTPGWHTYTGLLKSEQLDLVFSTCQSLANKNNNVYFINMLYDNRFIADDFFDGDHLDEIGAKKLTLILNDTLSKL